MDGDTLIEITWRPRSAPLAPIGVAAQGTAATKLAHRLLMEPVDVLSQLKGVGGPGLFVILGAEELLPWVDMVVYLGRDCECPSFLLPTNMEPSVPFSLLEQSLKARFVSLAPCALLLNPLSIIPVTAARPLARRMLLKWLEADL